MSDITISLDFGASEGELNAARAYVDNRLRGGSSIGDLDISVVIGSSYKTEYVINNDLNTEEFFEAIQYDLGTLVRCVSGLVEEIRLEE